MVPNLEKTQKNRKILASKIEYFCNFMGYLKIKSCQLNRNLVSILVIRSQNCLSNPTFYTVKTQQNGPKIQNQHSILPYFIFTLRNIIKKFKKVFRKK